jgi:hypothetical protein
LSRKPKIPKTDKDKICIQRKERSKDYINELAYIALILCIDDNTSTEKVAFNLVKGCKNKEYKDGNTGMAWESLRNKFEPVSAPYLIKLKKQFR